MARIPAGGAAMGAERVALIMPEDGGSRSAIRERSDAARAAPTTVSHRGLAEDRADRGAVVELQGPTLEVDYLGCRIDSQGVIHGGTQVGGRIGKRGRIGGDP